jgi:hypothetical protein
MVARLVRASIGLLMSGVDSRQQNRIGSDESIDPILGSDRCMAACAAGIGASPVLLHDGSAKSRSKICEEFSFGRKSGLTLPGR